MKISFPEHWSVASFKEVADVVTGTTPSTKRLDYYGNSIPFIGPSELGSSSPITSSTKWLSKEGGKEARLLPSESVLVCCIGATIGKIGFSGTTLATNQQINALVFDKSQVFPRYGFYYCQTLHKLIRDQGASTTLPILSKSRFQKIEIPLPPIAEQRRIAAILDKADAIRRKRKQAIQYTEELLRATFLDMFGDPVTNPKGWDVKPVEQLAIRITKGESPKWQGFSYQDKGVLFITSENVLWGEIDYSAPKFIPEEFHRKLKRSQLHSHDILINLVGASVGRTCLVPQNAVPANINQAVAVISLNQEVCIPFFLLHQILNSSIQRNLLGKVVESARANISLTNIRELEVIIPPLEEQKRWVDFCSREGLLKRRVNHLIQESDNLFNSLLQRAFRGELSA